MSPKTKMPRKAGYPAHVWTVDQATAYIQKIVGKPGLMVDRFSIETVTEDGNTLKLKWDRLNVGQPRKVVTEIKP